MYVVPTPVTQVSVSTPGLHYGSFLCFRFRIFKVLPKRTHNGLWVSAKSETPDLQIPKACRHPVECR